MGTSGTRAAPSLFLQRDFYAQWQQPHVGDVFLLVSGSEWLQAPPAVPAAPSAPRPLGYTHESSAGKEWEGGDEKTGFS